MTTNGQNPKKSSRADARPGGGWTRVGLAVGLTAVAAAAILAGEALRFSRVMAVEAHQIAPGVKIASVPVGVDGDAMNLDRIFSEGAGGEVADDEGGNDEELDEVLAMAVTGALGSEVEFDFLDEDGE